MTRADTTHSDDSDPPESTRELSIDRSSTTGQSAVRVLHVEDDPDFADLAIAALERAGLDVDTAGDARSGLTRLEADAIDCVVSDYDMPGMNGLAFLEAVREDHPNLPFILFTGKGSEEIASDAITAGVTDYLQKRGGLDQFTLLANRIENAVMKRRTEEALHRSEASHREAQRIAALGHWDLDVRTGDLFWSDQVNRIFGVGPGSFEGTYEDFLSFVHPEDRKAVERAVEVALANRSAYDVRHRVVRPDGTVRTVHERGEVAEEDGEPVFMRGTVQDVTEQAAIEAELEERRRNLASLHAAAVGLERCSDVDELFGRAVDAAASVLEFDCCAFYRDEDGRFRTVATSADLQDAETRPADFLEVLERTTAGETQFVGDDESASDVLPEPYHSALGVPVGERAVFLSLGRNAGTFAEEDARLAELLASHLAAVSARIERERDLRAFEEVVEAAGHSIYFTDLDGTIEYVNPAFCTATGYSREEAIGQNPRILNSGEHDSEFYTNIWGTILEGEVWRGEVVNHRKDDERYVVNQTIAPVEGAGGEIERFVAVNTDVTERKAREGALERSRRRYRSLVESSPDAIFVADVETGEIVETNPAASVLLGRPEAEIIGMHQRDLHPPDAPDEYHALFREHVANAPATMDRLANGDPIEVVRASGERVPVEINADVLEFEDQTLVLGVFRDLTQIRERERELERQNARLEEFASIVAHDLRNPLSVAMGTAETLDLEDEEAAEPLRAALARMADIIEELLALAKHGVAVDASQQVSLRDAAQRAWQTVETHEATLAVETERTVLADPPRLRAIMENVFANAVKHGGDSVSVRVGGLDDGFFVEDDGPGIPAERHEQVFEAGYTSESGGTGFGLAIVRRVAEAHGWSVVAREGRTGGARFEFRSVEAV